MKFLIFLAALLSTHLLLAQTKIPLRVNHDGVVVSTDTGILVKSFTDGLAPFMIKGKYPRRDLFNRVGFVDSAGRVRINPIYINCSPFVDGKALVKDTNQKVGMIDTNGRFILPVAYDGIDKCDNGLILVNKDKKIGLYSSSGTQLLAPEKYSQVSNPPISFTEADDMPRRYRFIWRLMDFSPSVRFKTHIGVMKDGQWGVINRSGEEVVAPRFDLVNVFVGNAAVAHRGKFAGVIDTLGRWLIPPVYRNVADDKGNWLFPPVYLTVSITPYQTVRVVKDKKMGVLSLQNKELIPFQYDKIIQLSNSAFLVSQQDGNLEGIVSQKNKFIIPLARHQIRMFGSGYVVRDTDSDGDYYNQEALYNSKGKQLIKYMSNRGSLNPLVWEVSDGSDSIKHIVYNSVDDRFVFYNDVLSVWHNLGYISRRLAYKKNGRWGLLSNSGAETTQPGYDTIKFLNAGKSVITFAQKRGRWGVIDSVGNQLVDFIYNEFGQASSGYCWLKKDGLYNLIFPNGYQTGLRYNRLYEGEKRDLYYIKYLVPVCANHKWGFLNSAGKEIFPCLYDDVLLLGDHYINGDDQFVVAAKSGQQWGLLNADLRILTPFKYESITGEAYLSDNQYIWVMKIKEHNKYGFLSFAGKEILACRYDKLTFYFAPTPIIKVTVDNLCGLLNRDGSTFIPLKYKQIDLFRSGSLWYRVTLDDKNYGIIDQTGKLVLPLTYDSIYTDSNGAVRASKDRHWGTIKTQDGSFGFVYDKVSK